MWSRDHEGEKGAVKPEIFQLFDSLSTKIISPWNS